MYSTRVLVLLALLVGFAHCFSWDIVIGGDKQLYFYYNGSLTHTEEILKESLPRIFLTRITSVTYDPVHYRVLFTHVNSSNMAISSFDLSTRKIQSLFTQSKSDNFERVVYDPVTQLLVWKTWRNIYTFSINPGSSNKAAGGNLLVHLSNACRDVAVDSCGGCEAGYSGDRCEVNACHEHCLNNGMCFLNEEDEPVCECTADYEGRRCDVAITHAGDCADTSTQQVLRDLRSEAKQLQHALQLFSDKIGEYEAKI